jgi:hypothetical protein
VKPTFVITTIIVIIIQNALFADLQNAMPQDYE